MRRIFPSVRVFSIWLFATNFPTIALPKVPRQLITAFSGRVRYGNMQNVPVRGGSEDSAYPSELTDVIANSKSFRKIVETNAHCRIRVDGNDKCFWDWRVMCPWAKEMSDEQKQFILEPMPWSNLHISSLEPDHPAHFDGQWKMGRTRRGSFSGVRLSHFTDIPDARELMLIYGGPWIFEDCEVQTLQHLFTRVH
jgi:hypothetical protein